MNQHSYVETVDCLPSCPDVLREREAEALTLKKINAWDKLMELVQTHSEVKFQNDRNGLMVGFGACAAAFGVDFIDAILNHESRHDSIVPPDSAWAPNQSDT